MKINHTKLKKLMLDRYGNKTIVVTVDMFSDELGVNPSTVWRWIEDENNNTPKLTTYLRLCKLLNIETDELIIHDT